MSSIPYSSTGRHAARQSGIRQIGISLSSAQRLARELEREQSSINRLEAELKLMVRRRDDLELDVVAESQRAEDFVAAAIAARDEALDAQDALAETLQEIANTKEELKHLERVFKQQKCERENAEMLLRRLKTAYNEFVQAQWQMGDTVDAVANDLQRLHNVISDEREREQQANMTLNVEHAVARTIDDMLQV